MTTRIEEIYEAVLEEMKINNIEDTPENRIIFLEGLQDSWNEDPDDAIEKRLYQMALITEIFSLKKKQVFPLHQK